MYDTRTMFIYVHIHVVMEIFMFNTNKTSNLKRQKKKIMEI